MLHFLDRAVGVLLTVLGILLIAMVGLSVWNVISRYVFDDALLWADEVATFSLIALAYLGMVVCAWRDSELRMDILVAILPDSVQHAIRIFQQILVAGFSGWTAWLSYGYVERVFRVGIRSAGADVPLWLVHAFVPFGLLMISLIALLRLASLLVRRAESFSTIKSAEVAIK